MWPMGLQKVPLGGFIGGMNILNDPFDLNHGESQKAINVSLEDVRGGVRPRKGWTTQASFKGLPMNIHGWRVGKLATHNNLLLISLIDEEDHTKAVAIDLDSGHFYGDIIGVNEGDPFIYDFEQFEKNFGAGIVDTMWGMGHNEDVAGAFKWTAMEEGSETWHNAPKGTMCVAWKNRMIVAGVDGFPQRLFYSDIGDPESPEGDENGGYGENWIDIKTSEDDLDEITNIDVVGDTLVVFKNRSVNFITDDATFSFTRVADIGCAERWQSTQVDGRIHFLHSSGMYSISEQGELRLESLNNEPIFTDESSVYFVDREALRTYGRVASDNRGRVYVTLCEGSAGESIVPNTVVWEAYPRLRFYRGRREQPRTPWVRHEFVSGIGSFALVNERLFASMPSVIPSFDSLVVKLFDGFPEDGGGTNQPVLWDWVSGFIPVVAIESFERVRRFNLLMKGKLTAIVRSGENEEQSATGTMESAEGGTVRSMETIKPETWGRYHTVELGGESSSLTEVYEGELAIRGGKEHED